MSFNKTPLEPGYKTKMCQNSMSPWCKENKQKNNKILSVEFNYTFSWGFWKCKLKSLKKNAICALPFSKQNCWSFGKKGFNCH